MIVDYNLNLAKLVLAGKVSGKFLLKTPSGEAPFRILELNRRCSGCLKGIGLWLKQGEFATEEEVLAFCPESGESANWKILIDLTDFKIGDIVAEDLDGKVRMSVITATATEHILANFWCYPEENTLFFGNYLWSKLSKCRHPTQRELDKFLKIIDENGYYLGKDNEICEKKKSFDPFEKVIVYAGVWRGDFFSHIEGDYYITTSTRRLKEDEIKPYKGNEYLIGTKCD